MLLVVTAPPVNAAENYCGVSIAWLVTAFATAHFDLRPQTLEPFSNISEYN
jgi:hypothetical protein